MEAVELGTELPRSLRRLMGKVERGSHEVGMRPEGLEPTLRRFERLANRLVLGMITAAFIVGLAVLMALYHPPGWESLLGPFFAFGFLIAGVYIRHPRRRPHPTPLTYYAFSACLATTSQCASFCTAS